MKKMLSKFGSIITKLQGNHKYVKWQIVSLLYTLCCKLHRYDFGIFLEGTTSPFDSLKDKYWTKQHYKIEHRLFWCLQGTTSLFALSFAPNLSCPLNNFTINHSITRIVLFHPLFFSRSNASKDTIARSKSVVTYIFFSQSYFFDGSLMVI